MNKWFAILNAKEKQACVSAKLSKEFHSTVTLTQNQFLCRLCCDDEIGGRCSNIKSHILHALISDVINKLVLPNKLEEIGESAFANSSLSELTIPSSVNSIGDTPINRGNVYLNVEPGSYAALWASENGYVTQKAGSEDTSWLN